MSGLSRSSDSRELPRNHFPALLNPSTTTDGGSLSARIEVVSRRSAPEIVGSQMLVASRPERADAPPLHQRTRWLPGSRPLELKIVCALIVRAPRPTPGRLSSGARQTAAMLETYRHPLTPAEHP